MTITPKPANLKATTFDATSVRSPAAVALAVSELRYRRLFETAKDGILILNAETGMVDDVNPFLIALLGYSHEDLIGKAVWDLGFLKDAIASQDKFFELQRQEYVRYENLPLETADGRRLDVEFVSNVYLVDHKRVIQCNIRDITERKRMLTDRDKMLVWLQGINQVQQSLLAPAPDAIPAPVLRRPCARGFFLAARPGRAGTFSILAAVALDPVPPPPAPAPSRHPGHLRLPFPENV